DLHPVLGIDPEVRLGVRLLGGVGQDTDARLHAQRRQRALEAAIVRLRHISKSLGHLSVSIVFVAGANPLLTRDRPWRAGSARTPLCGAAAQRRTGAARIF